VPGAHVTIQNTGTGVSQHFTIGPDGLYTFPNLLRGTYTLTVEAKGFRKYEQQGITIDLNARVTQDIGLLVGAPAQIVEVHADASPLNHESGVISETVPPSTIEDLPLTVSGAARNAASFVGLVPGVPTGAQAGITNMRFAGGPASGDESVLDGSSMLEGLAHPSGMAPLSTFPITPDAISSINVLTNNFDVQYGASTGGVVTIETKSGTKDFHGDLFEFGRNRVLNASSWGATTKPYDNEHEFGGTLGGPVHLPGFWGGRHKTYFFQVLEGHRISGGSGISIETLPTQQERQGNFSDWVNSSGVMIPIYDPTTTVANPAYTGSSPSAKNPPWIRTQFPGNIIPTTNPNFAFAQKWIQYLPANTNSAIVNNYVAPPIPSTTLAHLNESDTRVDEYIGSRDHIMASVRYRGSSIAGSPSSLCVLPLPICSSSVSAPNYSFFDRLNWDHTFSSNIVNHLGGGYQDYYTGTRAVDTPYAGSIPRIANVASSQFAPTLTFADSYQQFGNGNVDAAHNHEARLASIVNDVLSWSKGKHLFKMGGDFRFPEINYLVDTNKGGTFGFTDALTGAYGVSTSGNSFASFITGAAGTSSVPFCYICSYYSRSHQMAGFFGDTWKLSPKLTLSYGLRWDGSTPFTEAHNDFSFFDPNGVNTAAGGLLGTLAFAGTGWGSASFGRNSPFLFWGGGFGPRFGFAYDLGHKTVVRGGYGIFYGAPLYEWGGINQPGFGVTTGPTAGVGSVSPSIWMQSGACVTTGLAAAICGAATPTQVFPYLAPPVISSTFSNGKGMSAYNPQGDKLPDAQQFTLTIEHAFTNNLYVRASYTGSKGTHELAFLTGDNILNPSLLTGPLAPYLNASFSSTQTTLDGVNVPYSGWYTQLAGATPTSCSICTITQALRPYPQYNGNIIPGMENDGNSFYNGFALSIEKRTSHGLWLLASYSVQKSMGDYNANNSEVATDSITGNLSQFLRKEAWAVEDDDTPQNIKLALVYHLPLEKVASFAHSGFGRQVLGGWEVSTVYIAHSGIPWQVNVTCSVPSAFLIPCMPGLIPGASPYAQPESSFDPGKGPLLNVGAFEPASSFSTVSYWGQGPLVEPTIRQPGYDNQDASLLKTFAIKERLKFQIRADFMDMWNWHSFTFGGGTTGGTGNAGSVFTTNVSSASFGKWTGGSPSGPRVIVMAGKLIW
jgi:hypothetical protein